MKTRSTRVLDANKLPSVRIVRGVPSNSVGFDGEFALSQYKNEIKLYVKYKGTWHGVTIGKEFDKLKPETKKGSRRAYQKNDLLMVRQIRSLLYEEGLTIAGAKKRLNLKTSSNKFSSNDHLIDDLSEILKEIKQVI